MGETAVRNGTHADERGRRCSDVQGKVSLLLGLSVGTDRLLKFLEIWSEDGVTAEPEDDLMMT